MASKGITLLYRFVPNTQVAWKDVWIGAAMGALLFQGVRIGFTWFVVSFGGFNLVYGVLGSLMAVLVWSYLASMALMWGAQVSFTYSRLYGSQASLGIPPDLQETTATVRAKEARGVAGAMLTLGQWLLPINVKKRQP